MTAAGPSPQQNVPANAWSRSLDEGITRHPDGRITMDVPPGVDGEVLRRAKVKVEEHLNAWADLEPRAMYLSLNIGDPAAVQVKAQPLRGPVTFDVPASVAVVHVGMWTAPTGGRMLSPAEVAVAFGPSRLLPMPEVFLPLPRLRLRSRQ